MAIESLRSTYKLTKINDSDPIDLEGLQNLSRADAHAVEQRLIDFHGLGKDGGTLINKINSISKIKNPTKYEQALVRGAELLSKAGYEGF